MARRRKSLATIPLHSQAVAMAFEVAFDLELSHGRCVGVRLPDELVGDAAEIARARVHAAWCAR
jgi:hypothetical protein